MKPTYLYEQVCRVPLISDEQIVKMRHIEPVVEVPGTCWFRRIKGAGSVDPRKTAFNWIAEPTGERFTFGALDKATIVTQHSCSYFFKPSIDEVYAWILFYFGDEWRRVKFFCIGEPRRIGASTDYTCDCLVMGGEMLVAGRQPASGSIELVPAK